MKKYSFKFFWALCLAATALFSCEKTREVEAPETLPEVKPEDMVSIEAYIQKEDATKTTYGYDEVGHKYTFSWVEDDNIDVAVYNSVKDIASSVVFTLVDKENNIFQDGHVTDAPALSQMSGFALMDRAFYPSRVSPEAKEYGFAPDWSYSSGTYTIDLSTSINVPPTKPMAVVPLAGKRDGEGKYAFTQMTGVLAIPVKNLPLECDFLSVTHPDVALAGYFTIDTSTDVAEVKAADVLTKDEAGVTLHFSGITSDDDPYIFYVPIPTGEIAAGLTITVGSSTNEDILMSVSTKKAFTLGRGVVAKTPAIEFTPIDQLWADYTTGKYIDDFLWSRHGWTDPVPVTIQRSGLHPEKYRINNPYTVACTQFGYTPFTEGITSDPYFVFRVADDGTVTYPSFKTGIEDINTEAGKPSMLNNGGDYTRVTSYLTSGDFWKIGFGTIYTLYNPDENPSHKWTRTGSAVIHLTVDVTETWTGGKVADGTFIDEKMWSLHSWGSDKIDIELYQSDQIPTHFRIPNPYQVAKTYFSYSTYTAGITADEYLDFCIEDGDAVTFTTFNAGIESLNSAGFPVRVYYPSDYGSGFEYAIAGNVVNSYRSDGLPAEVELYPLFVDVNGVPGNRYTDWKELRVKMTFPEAESWDDVATLEYMDDFYVHSIAGRSSGVTVPVTLQQSNLDPKRFRIANPYPALATAAGVAAGYVYASTDDYLVMTVDGDDKITFGDFRPGIGRTDWEFSFCDAEYWNTQSSTTMATGFSRVVSYDGNGFPKYICLYGVYHKIGEYNTGNRYSRVNDQYSDKPYMATSFPVDDVWTSIGTGRFRDKLVWECAGLSEYAEAEFQQHVYYPNKFRIAKPYPGTDSDDWFVFDVTDPNQVVSTKYYVDYEVTAAGKETYKPYVWTNYYTNDYCKVLRTQDNGMPAVVELGICYRYEPWSVYDYSYDYEIGRDHEELAIEIIFPGCEPYLTLSVTPYQSPIIKNFHLPVARLSAPKTGTLERLVVKITGGDYTKMSGLRLYGPSGWMQSDYVAPDASGVVTMTSFSNSAVTGSMDLNFWIDDDSMIGSVIRFDVQEFVMSGQSYNVEQDKDFAHFPGVRVNHGGDLVSVRGYGGIVEESVSYFRIPALVTSNDGTLIAAYDVRYDGMGDLVNDIDVGVKRSTDGGKTWSDLTLAMDMGTYGFSVTDQASWKNAQRYNGIGDPCLLVDENTGRIFCFAVWTNGEKTGDTRSLAWAAKGFDIEATPQFMMVYSDDDGITWSEPVNLTRQMKKYDWRMTFQGPGRGITMADGTLVIPIQHQEGEVKNMHSLYPLNSGIAYSKDHGLTWHAHNFAHTITSESCVAEIAPGTLLLSMRDETDAHTRRNYITTDLGRTWTKHASDGKLIDSTCEASILHVNASDNVLGKDLVLFSNPKNAAGRSNYHIQASEDGGETWTHSLQIDAGGALGYTCLTMVDNATVGILYESSRGHIVFQAIPLTEIVK